MPFYFRLRLGPVGYSKRLSTKSKNKWYFGKDGDWKCAHHHRTLEAAEQCSLKHQREMSK